MVLPLAAIALLWHVIIVIWLIVAVSLILVVLIQKGRGGGLAAAFGGGGASSLLGTKTGDFLTWLTIGLVAVFLILSVVMGLFMQPLGSGALTEPSSQQQPAPAAAETQPPAVPVEQAAPSGGPQAVPVAETSPAQPQPETASQPAGTDAPK